MCTLDNAISGENLARERCGQVLLAQALEACNFNCNFCDVFRDCSYSTTTHVSETKWTERQTDEERGRKIATDRQSRTNTWRILEHHPEPFLVEGEGILFQARRSWCPHLYIHRCLLLRCGCLIHCSFRLPRLGFDAKISCDLITITSKKHNFTRCSE